MPEPENGIQRNGNSIKINKAGVIGIISIAIFVCFIWIVQYNLEQSVEKRMQLEKAESRRIQENMNSVYQYSIDLSKKDLSEWLKATSISDIPKQAAIEAAKGRLTGPPPGSALFEEEKHQLEAIVAYEKSDLRRSQLNLASPAWDAESRKNAVERKNFYEKAAKSQAANEIEARKSAAQEMQHTAFMNGMDIHFSVSGSSATTLTATWVLFNDPAVEQIRYGSDQLISKCKNLGFRRLIISTGFGKAWEIKLGD